MMIIYNAQNQDPWNVVYYHNHVIQEISVPIHQDVKYINNLSVDIDVILRQFYYNLLAYIMLVKIV